MKRLLGRVGIALALLLSTIVVIPNATAAACSPETTISGAYTVVAFKTTGSCTWTSPTGTVNFRGLIVAGGGGGGYNLGGGGGGGGYVEFETLTVTSNELTIVIGSGGAGAASLVAGSAGGSSSITGSSLSLVARGGAGGATSYESNSYPATLNGGSGGGSSGANDYPNTFPQDRSSAGTQTTQNQTPLLSTIAGNQFGGNGAAPGSRWYPGGGGGAGGSGSNTPGDGGSGRANTILGTSYFWAGGGGGSGWDGFAGVGGSGGGGGGGAGNASAGTGGLGGAGLNNGFAGAYVGGAGGANTGGGGGAGTYSNYSGGNGGSGIVVLRYLTFSAPTTFSTTQSTPTNITTAGTISYSLIFSQSVTGLAADDFQFSGATCNSPGVSGSGSSYTITVTNCNTGAMTLQLKANSVTGTSLGPPSVSSANTIVIDRTAPTISSLSAPANGTYIPTNTPTFTMVFSESVTVTGTPRLTLTVGALTKYATFLSLADSKTATFRYTVASAAGEFDSDGIAVATALDLNGGAIADLATNAISNLNFSAPTLTSVLVAQTPGAPTIGTITPSNAQLSVAFTAGDSNGASISNYEYSTDNGATWKARANGTTASPLLISTISGSASALSNGTAYNIRIRALNAAGSGDSSTAVSATPSAVVVSGDATLTLTYGNSASTGTYTSTGGTGPYTYTLSASATGVSIAAGVITASSSTPAGTYTRNVISTDSAAQSGTKALTITVNKAATTISIALPGAATTAAASSSVTITATVSRAGSVNFQLGGVTISGCATAAAASTTATCSWSAPNTLGSVSLSAIFTPTDTSNFETSTSTTLTITIVNGTSTLSISLAGGVTSAPKGQAILITASVDQAGRVSFTVDGKTIPRCINRLSSGGSATCSWKPAVQKAVTIMASLNPTNNVYQGSSSSMAVQVVRRTGTR